MVNSSVERTVKNDGRRRRSSLRARSAKGLECDGDGVAQQVGVRVGAGERLQADEGGDKETAKGGNIGIAGQLAACAG